MPIKGPSKRVKFEIGQGFAGDGSSITGELKLMQEDAFKVLLNNFGAYHCVKGFGAWTGLDGAGPEVKEPSLFITVYTDKADALIYCVAAMLKATFKQDTILLTIERGVEVSYV